MHRATSADGTIIAYTRAGDGPPLVLVGGALDDGAENAALVPELAHAFTVFNYARRGRGASGDTPPYAVEREIEDLAAVLEAAGGSAAVYGVSSGGALALRAAAAGLPIPRLGLYDVPYILDDAHRWDEYVREVGAAVDDGRREDALALFMRVAGVPVDAIAAARGTEAFARSAALAHTLPYDAACIGEGPPPPFLADLTTPTLVASSGDPFFEAAADATAALLPDAERFRFQDQGHVADPMTVAPTLKRFFGN